MRLAACALVLAVGCGSSPDAPSCESACFEQRWWINVALANCSVFCMGNPGLPECAHADCKEVSAEIFVGGMVRTLAPMAFSAENRSFDLLGAVTSDTYSVRADCKVAIGTHTPEAFACNGNVLTFSVGRFTAASAGQAAALDAAAAANAPGQYRY